MPNIPCPVQIPCDCTASPWSNLSEEAPDLPFIYSTAWAQIQVPLGVQAPQAACMAVCTGGTQSQADLCAQENAFLCATQGWTDPSPFDPPQPPVPPPRPTRGSIPRARFFSNPQTGSAECPDGNFSEFVVPAGAFAAFSQAAADAEALSYANRQASLGRICLSALPTEACLGQPLTLTITATGARLATGMDTNNWEVTALPPGLDTTDGAITGNQLFITGTPTVPGNYTFFVTLTDPAGDTINVGYDLVVAGITGDPLPATVGTAYSGAIATTGFTSPQFSLASGSLPPGLSMDVNGNITGIPTAAGTYNFEVQITGM